MKRFKYLAENGYYATNTSRIVGKNASKQRVKKLLTSKLSSTYVALKRIVKLKGHSHEKMHMFFWSDSAENDK